MRNHATGAFALFALVACAPRGTPVAHLPPVVVEAAPLAVEDPETLLGEGFALSDAPAEVADALLGTAVYDLPVEANDWVRMELEFLVNQRHEVVGRWMQRADRYADFVREVLEEHGLPRDLIHLAMIESGFQPTIRSRAGAVGIWQFMPATGRGMGLRVDSLVDERMDPIRSTRAAARHLRYLHGRFGGDWPLAAAAYNAGEGRIGRALTRFGVADFWSLAQVGDLAQETRHYVPRLYAMTIIGNDPERFGFPPRPPARLLRVDSVRLDLAVPLPVLAEIGGVPADELRELNPHLVRHTAPRDYVVWVPAGEGEAIRVAFVESEFRRRGGFAQYRVREGDSVEGIARLAGITPEALRALNAPAQLDRLRPGERVRVYADGVRALEARPLPRSAAAGRTHTVRSGESLWTIARHYGVTVQAVRAANGLRGDTIRPGQRLRIPGGGSAAAASAPAGNDRERRAVEHTVADGETLWGIARRYDTSVDSLRRANDLGDTETIRPGQRLSIPR